MRGLLAVAMLLLCACGGDPTGVPGGFRGPQASLPVNFELYDDGGFDVAVLGCDHVVTDRGQWRYGDPDGGSVILEPTRGERAFAWAREGMEGAYFVSRGTLRRASTPNRLEFVGEPIIERASDGTFTRSVKPGPECLPCGEFDGGTQKSCWSRP